MTRLVDDTIERSRVAATVTQVVAAYAGPELRPCHAAAAFGISRNVPQGGNQQRLVASSCDLAEPILRVGEELDDVLRGGC